MTLDEAMRLEAQHAIKRIRGELNRGIGHKLRRKREQALAHAISKLLCPHINVTDRNTWTANGSVWWRRCEDCGLNANTGATYDD